jgi:hypothetical protein
MAGIHDGGRAGPDVDADELPGDEGAVREVLGEPDVR